MTDSAVILCVDDEPINLAIMQELLQDRYDLDTVKSGSGCLAQVVAHRPDLILLDVNMPEMDGLETCRRLKLDPQTADIPVIFVSALASQSELMAGYEAGGDDYITKPFSEAILGKKIDVVLASQRRRQELQQFSARAVEDLRDNLSLAGELGLVLRFLAQNRIHGSLDALVREVFDCLRRMNLDSSLMVIDQPENRIWFSDDIDRPMERQILESLHGQDRVVSFGTRLAINSDNVTLLVRNLPGDEEKIVRLRELLTILVGGLEVRVRDLRSEQWLVQQRKSIARLLERARGKLGEIETTLGAEHERCERVLAALKADIETQLTEPGLERRQGKRLARLFEAADRDLLAVPGDGTSAEELLRALTADFDEFLKNQD